MREISPSLFIGTQADYESVVKPQDGWWVVHACKDPYHRQLLGYKGRGAPKGPHYFRVRHRPDVLTLNMVDVEDPAYVSKEELIDPCLDFIHEGLGGGNKVLVHCNQGESRAPGIGMLYLITYTDVLPRTTFPEAEQAFLQLYPGYNPKGGIRGFIRGNWEYYTTKNVV
jgi:hypothetical protein